METRNKKFKIVNILDAIESIGESDVQDVLADFSCTKCNQNLNKEIEAFLKNDAISFAKKGTAITYFVYNDASDLVGIYTYALKTMELSADGLSETTKKKLNKFVRVNDENNYNIPSFLIAQFSRNFAIDNNVTGDELMCEAINGLLLIKKQIGGGVVMLECEDKPKLLKFYKNETNRFIEFGSRFSEKENVEYKQLYRII